MQQDDISAQYFKSRGALLIDCLWHAMLARKHLAYFAREHAITRRLVTSIQYSTVLHRTPEMQLLSLDLLDLVSCLHSCQPKQLAVRSIFGNFEARRFAHSFDIAAKSVPWQ